jgi:TonB family protein
MKLFIAKNFSSIISIIFHVILFGIIIFFFNQKPPEPKEKVIEIGFGGTVESNSPGGGKEGGPSVQPVKEAHKKIEKKKVKPHEDEINDKNKTARKKTQSTAEADTGKGKSAGNLAGGGSDTGAGTGTGGGGTGEGTGPAKKGLYIPNDVYYVAVDQMPVPIGGSNIINEKVYYPPQAKANNIQGTVYVLAFIDERGYVKKTSLIKGIGYGCDQAAIQAVKSTRFEPGVLHGMTVKVQLTVPVIFSR